MQTDANESTRVAPLLVNHPRNGRNSLHLQSNSCRRIQKKKNADKLRKLQGGLQKIASIDSPPPDPNLEPCCPPAKTLPRWPSFPRGKQGGPNDLSSEILKCFPPLEALCATRIDFNLGGHTFRGQYWGPCYFPESNLPGSKVKWQSVTHWSAQEAAITCK